MFRRTAAAALAFASLLGIAAGAQGEPRSEFVRLDEREANTPTNDHPYSVTPERLRHMLVTLKVARTISPDAVAVFTEEQLKKIAAPLASALAMATPAQDVVFAITGKNGVLGNASPSRVTTARVFAREGSLNLIFGLVHERYESGELGFTPPAFEPGRRAHRLDPIWKIVPDSTIGHLDGKRADWVVFDAPALHTPSAARAPAANSAPASAEAGAVRYRNVKQRLEILDRLQADGLITEEEYRQRRRAVLDGI